MSSPQLSPTPKAAVHVMRDSVQQLGFLSLEDIADRLHVPIHDAIAALENRVFHDPYVRAWRQAEEYLSGNVAEKLAVAASAAQERPERYQANVAALQRLQPGVLLPSQITAQLGAAWIPVEVHQQFVRELLDDPRASVKRENDSVPWRVLPGSIPTPGTARSGVVTNWSIDRADAYQLIELSLNSRGAAFTRQADNRNVRDLAGTIEAVRMQQRIHSAFTKWVWQDPERARQLAAAYTDRYASTLARPFDGSALSLPAASSGRVRVTAQSRAQIERSCTLPASLTRAGHSTERTHTMVTTALTLKEREHAAKPMIVVDPLQFAEFVIVARRDFPNANFMAISHHQLSSANRTAAVIADCANHNWDAVLIDHDAFDAIPLSSHTHARILREQIRDYAHDITQLHHIDPRHASLAHRGMGMLSHVSRVENAGIQAQHGFDGLHVDHLQVSDAERYLGLSSPTHMDGWPGSGDNRAHRFEAKMLYLRGTNPDHVATLYTKQSIEGMSQLHSLQRLLQPQRLRELGLSAPDRFAATFFNREMTVATTRANAPGTVTFSVTDVINLPELTALCHEVGDNPAVGWMPPAPTHIGGAPHREQDRRHSIAPASTQPHGRHRAPEGDPRWEARARLPAEKPGRHRAPGHLAPTNHVHRSR
ncbi:hypothetical protein GCM10022247_34940 [Allokutzneria multivorans]|uniref:Uncharacterized protein n=1 Tax=Allokutzneria multivorans TaxID=1142134 RepID=A0ABP7SCC8_9PSEU